MPKASEIMVEAAIVLQDEDHVRWTLPELNRWINGGQNAIVLAKPSANARSVEISLEAGTLQRLYNADHLLLLRLPRNLLATGQNPRQGGRAIRPTDRETLDAAEPEWANPAVVPFRKEVRQYCYDEANPREFYVYPGNDGTGVVEAVVSKAPATIAASGDVNQIASYNTSLELQAPYGLPLLDYVLFRAYSKDAVGADAGRANFHYLQFANALGIKVQIERATSPNTEARVTGR